MNKNINQLLWACCLFFSTFTINLLSAQPGIKTQWSKDGNAYYEIEQGKIVAVNLLDPTHPASYLDAAQLTPKDSSGPLNIRSFTISTDQQKVLIFTNTKKVWRYHTRGDYWIYDFNKNS